MDERTPDTPDAPEPRLLARDAGSATPDRRLAQGEVARILRVAADADALEGVATEGITLPELARAAREAGIDPALVRRAAAVVEDPTSSLAVTAFGAPDTRTLRAAVPGRALPKGRAREELVRAVEQALRRGGQLQESEADRLVWKEDHTLGRTRLEMVETDGGTELVLEADRAGHYLGAWFLGVVGWGLLSAFTPLGALGPAASVLGFLVAPFLLARPFWIRSDRRRHRRLESAVMRALERLEDDRRDERLLQEPGDGG